MRARCLVVGLVAATLAGEPIARAQWQLGEADRPWERRAPADDAALAQWREAVEAEAWIPDARRSPPTLAVGLTLVSVGAVAALVGSAVEAGGNSDGQGVRLSMGGAALASLAIPLIPFGAQRVGYHTSRRG
jgi:hypothetical protein